MMNVEPILAPLVAKGCLRLSDLVGVVGECVVDTTAVNIKILTEELGCNARALDVPTGITDAPRRIPLKLLIVKLRLCEPKHEVRLILLIFVSLYAVTNTYLKILFLKVIEDIVLLKL